MFGFFGVKKKNETYLAEIEKRLKPYITLLSKRGFDKPYYDAVVEKSLEIKGLLIKSDDFNLFVEQQIDQANQDLESAKREAREKEKEEQLAREREEKEKEERLAREREIREREIKETEERLARKEERLARKKEIREKEAKEKKERLAREREIREREVRQKYETVLAYALSLEKKIAHTKNDVLIRTFKNLQNILSSEGMKKLLADQAFDFYLENLSTINDNLSNFEKMADVYPDQQKHIFPPKSALLNVFKTSPKALFTLFEGCVESSESLQEYHKSQITDSNAYKIWSDHENYEFLTDEMKRAGKKAESLDKKINKRIKNLTCAEYYKFFKLITRFEDEAHASLESVKSLKFNKVTIIHKEWLEFIRLGRGLTSIFACLSVHSEPSGADVKLNGIRIGTTPIEKLWLPEGDKSLEFTKSLYEPVKSQIHLKAGDEQDVNVRLKRIEPITGMEFIYVSGGSFKMGSSGAYENEKPVHEVRLDGFFIGKYPVTQKQWQKVMGNNPSTFKGEFRPVENVSWDDCNQFIDKLNHLSKGFLFSLPTEAQWEFAARGGTIGKGYTYAGANNPGEVAWYKKNSGSQTHDVGGKKANELGLHDMAGNVWEWCQDWYDERYYHTSPKENPQGPSNGSARVIRGGGLNDKADGCRSAVRSGNDPSKRYATLGFRLVLPAG